MTHDNHGEDFDILYEAAQDFLLKEQKGKNEAIEELEALCTLMDVPIRRHIIEMMVDDIIKKKN